LSIVIPAYNEEKLIGRCLACIAEAIAANAAPDWTSEVIVVDNNSTDGTAALARAAGTTVVFEAINQILRARNAGATAASGDWLLFVDADSYLHAATLAELLGVIRQGCYAGGGCQVGLDESPRSGEILMAVWNAVSRLLKWAAGSFIFCREDAFR